MRCPTTTVRRLFVLEYHRLLDLPYEKFRRSVCRMVSLGATEQCTVTRLIFDSVYRSSSMVSNHSLFLVHAIQMFRSCPAPKSHSS